MCEQYQVKERNYVRVCVCVFVSVYLPHKKTKKVVKNLGTETDSIKSMKTNKHTHTQTKRENSTLKKVLFGWWLLFYFFLLKILKREKNRTNALDQTISVSVSSII